MPETITTATALRSKNNDTIFDFAVKSPSTTLFDWQHEPHPDQGWLRRAGVSTESGHVAAVPAQDDEPILPTCVVDPMHDVELARVQGVVLGAGAATATVKVQLSPSGLVAEFPAVLLGTLAKHGQPIDYVVLRRPSGYRYQRFVARQVGENPVLAKLEQLLSVIDE